MTTIRFSLLRPTDSHRVIRRLLCAFALFGAVGTAGCVNAIDTMTASDAVQPASAKVSNKDQECLARAMYFESNRSSESGMLAVGTVVMNRVSSERYPNSVCDVVGQRGQFASGVMSRTMTAGKDMAMDVAHDVLAGKRHKDVKTAMYFHTAGMRFGYRNMNYVAVAGGNAFYQKIQRGYRVLRMATQKDVLMAQAKAQSRGETFVTTASAMMPKENEQQVTSPFQAIWKGLTSSKSEQADTQVASTAQGPLAGPSATETADTRVASKGGRAVRANKRKLTTAPSAVDEAALEDRMGDLPGVASDLGSMMSASRGSNGASASGVENAFAGGN